MADPFIRTFGHVKRAIFRAAGDLVRTGTATGGSTTTIVDTALIDATGGALKGVNIYVFNGAGQSQETRATAFTPGTDTVTVPTQGTAFASGSEYIFSRRFTQSDALEALRQALYVFGRWGKDYVDQSLIFGSPLANATFYDGSGTFPNGWTVSGGTWTQESTISKHGRYSAKGVSSGAAAALIRQDVLNVGLYRGLSAQLRGWMNSNTTGSRVDLTLEDGIDTTTGVVAITTANRGWGSAEAVTPALTVSDRATRLRAICNITDGSAVTAYFSGLWITPVIWNEWPIPAGSPTAITKVNIENGDGSWSSLWVPTEGDALQIVRETTRRLRYNGSARAGHIMEIVGRTSWVDHATAATDDDTNFDWAYDWIVPAAAAKLLLMKGSGTGEDKARADDLQAEADRIMARGSLFPALPAEHIKIERG